MASVDDFDQLDDYEMLGVERGASSDELKRAFRRQMGLYHPDRFATADAEDQAYAARRATRINAAYRRLSGQDRRSGRPESPRAPAAHRDYQAELYDQAQAHLAAGRAIQAAATLRELQQINPFYRDSAELLSHAEELAGVRPRPHAAVPAESADQQRRPSRRALLVGLGGAGAAALALAALRFRQPTIAGLPEPTAVPPTAEASAAPPTAEATAAPPTAAPPTAEATAAPPTAAPPTAEATAAPPTAAPPTAVPTAEVVAFSEEAGALVIEDSLAPGGGWAEASGAGWSVGYRDARYAITAVAGAGSIWSYRSTPNLFAYTLGVDVQSDGGPVGLLVRFSDGANYLAYTLEPQIGTLRIVQRSAGSEQELFRQELELSQLQTNTVYRLAVRLTESELTAAFDGAELTRLAINSPPPTNRFGLVVIGNQQAVIGQFQRLVVRQNPA